MQFLKQMVWVGAVVGFTAAAPVATAAIATDGTVRVDLGELIDQSVDFNQGAGELPEIGGVTVTNATGFFLLDIGNNSLLDAEMTFSNQGTLLRTFGESLFTASITGNDLVGGFVGLTPAEGAMGNFKLSTGPSVLAVDLANETGSFTVRFIADPGFSPNYHLISNNPTLTFTPVPEPASAGLILALGGLLLRRRHAR